jgi:hypothetical protein
VDGWRTATTPAVDVGQSDSDYHRAYALPLVCCLTLLIWRQCKLWPNTVAELKTNAAGLVELQLWPGAFAPDLLEHVVLSAVIVQCYVQSGELLMPRWAT